MCSINGFNFENRELIDEMNLATAHRGPDGTGTFFGNGVSLGHNRLAIIDLSKDAGQPMVSNDNQLTIVFNGEIYNFIELKKELTDYKFRTKSDTEVILAGYQKWGKDVVKKLNGMFAFAIWDKENEELFIARDRSGIKPLYYFWDGKRFIFSSEVKAVLLHDVPRVLDKEAFNLYMRVLYVPSPLTMVKGVFKLPPQHTISLKNGEIKITKYEVEKTDIVMSYSEAKTTLREKTIEAVRRQLVSDVPIGVYLSGGIDSSAVLFAMSRFQKNIKTFSIGFDLEVGEEADKFNQDFELAKRTADFFGVEHHPFIMTGEDVMNYLHKAIIQNDDPISNPTSLAMMFLANSTKKEATVVLTGNGGDELFGGYERYRLAVISSYYKKLPKFLRNIGDLNSTIRKLDPNLNIDLFARFMFEKDSKLSRIISKNILKPDSYAKKYFSGTYPSLFGGDTAEGIMKVDRLSWLPDQALMLADKMSMSSAIEERVPLLDNELVSFAESLPRDYKVSAFRTKKIFKDAFRKDLPDFLFDQPKRGWFAPGSKWLRRPDFSRMAREILSPDYYHGTKDLFNWDELRIMLDDHISRKEYNLVPLWAVLTLQVWAKQYNVTL